MLDIKLFRENPEVIKENLRKKFQESKLPTVDEIVILDKEVRAMMAESQSLRNQRNTVSAQIAANRKKGVDVSDLMAKAKEIPQQLASVEEGLENKRSRLNKLLITIPNIMHDSVPIGKNDSENVVVEVIGKPKKKDFEVINHAEIAESLNIVDFESARRIAGNGFFFLKGGLAQLNQALIQFAINFLITKGYEFVEPPLMIRKEICDGVVDFEFFKNMIYKIEDENLYLIGTSEHPLIGMFVDQLIDKADLPIKIVGYSQCFRKELGSHGIDEKGLFRTHQFNKVEQIIICEPEDSYKHYDELLQNSKEMFTLLGLPTRVLECCSGDLADLKAKSADLEAWSPRKNGYIEVCSCSNLTDAQSRGLNIRVRSEGKNYFPHTLNDTAIATSRALVAILENYQTKEGTVIVPEVLRPYMGGVSEISLKSLKAG